MGMRRAATAEELVATQAQVGGTNNESGDAGVTLEADWAADDASYARVFPGRALTDAEAVALFWQRQSERRQVRHLTRLRSAMFWGPFWAIIASGAVGAVLWFIAMQVLASQAGTPGRSYYP